MRRLVGGTQAQRAAGVTLPELLVVLAIIGITVAIVVPTLGSTTGKGRLRAGARGLSAAFREARRLAVSNRDNYAVVIDCNALTEPGPEGRPVTRFWIARVDLVFDPAADATDLPHSGGPAPFDGEFTTLEQVGDEQELPAGVVMVAGVIGSVNFQGDDFATLRINAMRTEDINRNGGVSAAEDVGVNGFDDGNGAAVGRAQAGTNPVDPGEDDEADDDEDPATGGGEDIDPVYRVVRFGPQGNADRAIIWLWDVDDGRTPLPESIIELPGPPAGDVLPQSLIALGLPPGMIIQDAADQRNYLSVSDQAADTHYYTVQVNPLTGKTEVFDYARGTGTVGPPADWDLDKDGEV